MININVRSDISGALRKFQLIEDDAKRAIPRALNKTMTTARAQAARQIVDVGYGLKISGIRKSISIERASVGRLRAAIRATGRPIPLIYYGARETSKGVSVDVLHGRKVIPHAFIATMPSGHEGVFIRVGAAAQTHAALAGAGITTGKPVRSPRSSGKHGLPIRELFGPSIPAAFSNRAVREALVAAVRDRFPVVLSQELRYVKLKKGR
jgi:Prophage minor tail protein Z (GPZ)